MSISIDQETLDRAYNNGAAVADSGAITDGWQRRSAQIRNETVNRLDWRYATAPRCTIDHFAGPDAQAPLLVFFHGGYWQSRHKDDFSFIAAGPLAAGMSVALVGYSLAPQATLDTIVEECRQAVDFLKAELGPGRMVLAGWSAGAHLTASVLDAPGVAGGLAISGVYDLLPLMPTYLNRALGLNQAAAERLSPMQQPVRSRAPLTVAWGTDELPALCAQSTRYLDHRKVLGRTGRSLPIAGANHFTVLEELARPNGLLTVELVRLASPLVGL